MGSVLGLGGGDASRIETYRSAERLTFFTDAVVAIAMTLLILPLMESVSEAGAEGLSTADYLDEHNGQIFAFALSFAIIASFWRAHHALFEHLESYSQLILWLNMLWMFTIVWLPVATALVGSLETDRPQLALYIGSMLANGLVLVALHLALRRTPALWVEDNPPTSTGTHGLLTFVGLLALALFIALVWPAVGYLSLFVLFLSGPLRTVLARSGRSSG